MIGADGNDSMARNACGIGRAGDADNYLLGAIPVGCND
jgi:hypothetical protein